MPLPYSSFKVLHFRSGALKDWRRCMQRISISPREPWPAGGKGNDMCYNKNSITLINQVHLLSACSHRALCGCSIEKAKTDYLKMWFSSRWATFWFFNFVTLCWLLGMAPPDNHSKHHLLTSVSVVNKRRQKHFKQGLYQGESEPASKQLLHYRNGWSRNSWNENTTKCTDGATL